MIDRVFGSFRTLQRDPLKRAYFCPLVDIRSEFDYQNNRISVAYKASWGTESCSNGLHDSVELRVLLGQPARLFGVVNANSLGILEARSIIGLDLEILRTQSPKLTVHMLLLLLLFFSSNAFRKRFERGRIKRLNRHKR